jgi:hypothetical protein
MFLLVSKASAVLISTGTGMGNTTAPANDPGFANVGICASGSAVYLGGGWVLTAAHVYEATGELPAQTWFNGAFYKTVTGSGVSLVNPAGVALSQDTDLEMFRISNPPNLPSISITPTAPAAGWPVVMVGNGRDRTNSQLEYWTPNWQPSATPTALAGDIWGTMQDIRWGTNVITQASVPQGIGLASEMAFSTTFNANGTAYESQGTPGDSGGAVFHQDPKTGAWSLAGIMFSTSSLPSQPWATSVFGDTTWSADLSYYRTEINTIMTMPGDLNHDGIVNSQDLALITSTWMKSGAGSKAPAGDVNHDGIVNGQDLALIASLVNGASSSGMSIAGVPEPASGVTALAALAGLLFFARRRLRASA